MDMVENITSLAEVNKQENILSFETANSVAFMLLPICSREIWYLLYKVAVS